MSEIQNTQRLTIVQIGKGLTPQRSIGDYNLACAFQSASVQLKGRQFAKASAVGSARK
ncbi:hypothetical protein [Kouleothrix sp.]|uniref:hypothetical protein n=1 Tax=Kouleothrix sp. TaxID=2779161 RepID=UPI003919DAF4